MEPTDETIFPPSPNWFQMSGVAVSPDGWIVYGGPSKSLCFLEPLPADQKGVLKGPRYHAHVFPRVNAEKVISVDISPEWPEKRLVLTGCPDGIVKQWSLEKHPHSSKLKSVLSHDVHSKEKEEIAGVSYSNETYAVTVGSYGNVVKWDITSNIVKTFNHIKNFRPLCMACSPHVALNVAIGTKQGVVLVMDLNGNGKIIYKVRGQDDEILNISWCPQFEVMVKKTLRESEKRKQQDIPKTENVKEILEASGLEKNLPDDSFDTSTNEDVGTIEPEDDMFDIYTDHAADEFGHKKYQPEDITVKVEETTKQDDFLAECLKLKEEILKRKSQEETSIQTLVDALEDTHVDSKENENPSKSSDLPSNDKVEESVSNNIQRVEASSHMHKHLLASIGKYGGIRIWSKSGKLVASCVLPNIITNNTQYKVKHVNWPTVLWYKPDTLIVSDLKSQLVECNPLKIDCKNKLDCNVVHHLHKRGLFCIKTNAPRIQTGQESYEGWNIYTASQDRNIIQYSMHNKKKSVIATCGGFVYTTMPCPYDASKVALSVGDGAVRVWQTSTLEDDESKLAAGNVTSFWQNVQGKVLVVAWHPTRENLLAFATAESRVGLIDTSGEKPARAFIPALSGGVYSICWGEGYNLYACGNGDLVVYNAKKMEEAATPITISLDGRACSVSAVRWSPRALLAGALAGAVAVLEPHAPHAVLAAAMPFSKMIYMAEWHPQQTSSSSEESPHRNLIAVCSCEKIGTVIVLEYLEKEDGSKQLQNYKSLVGHKMPALQLAWNPHVEAQLLTSSQDRTVRVWDVTSGACVSIFPGHAGPSLGAAWAPQPHLASKVMSGGGDCTLRLWDIHDWPAENYQAKETLTRGQKKRLVKDKKIKDQEKEKREEAPKPVDYIAAVNTPESLYKAPKKYLLPNLHRQQNRKCQLHAAKIMFRKYLEKHSPENEVTKKVASEIASEQSMFFERFQDGSSESSEVDQEEEEAYNFDYLKVFGSVKEINELLDEQMEQHLAYNNVEGWMTLCVFRGHIDAMLQLASQRDMLCPFLLSMAPCVSYKYWKDATQLYVAQIDRLVAKGQEKKLTESRAYGGAALRKVATLLSAHDVKGAVAALVAAHLPMEAYVLCRIRYMDSIAEEVLKQWAQAYYVNGLLVQSATCQLVLGNLAEAAKQLSRLHDKDCLDLAQDIAKVAGLNILAEHIEVKRELVLSNNSESLDKTDEILDNLPSRMELLMKDGKLNGNSDNHNQIAINGEATKE